MKIFTLIMALCFSGAVSAQVGISAGGSMLKGFGQRTPWGGFHVGVEIPRDDAISIYGKVTHHFKQRSSDSSIIQLIAYDQMTVPYVKNLGALPSMNYTILEGGTRYYLGNGYDFGWAGYGGTNVLVAFNSVKMEFGPYDQVLYELPEEYRGKGSIVSLGVGLAGGVKYSITGTGTFYFDAGLSYMLLSLASNSLAQIGGVDKFSQLIFNFNLGFRRDIMW